MTGEMHTRSCVRLPGGVHASAARLCLCTLDGASEKFLDILFSYDAQNHKPASFFFLFFMSVTVVTKHEREAMKRSRQPLHESRDLGILSEVKSTTCFQSLS